MKKASILTVGGIVGLAALMLVSGSAVTVAGQGDNNGVPNLLSQILAQLGVIEGQLDGLTGGGSERVTGVASAESLVVNPPNGTDHVLVDLAGPGVFIAARMTKQGGTSGITQVTLEIDGNVVVGRTFEALKNWGMTQNNPYGVVVLTGPGGIDAATIGFSEPVAFESNLRLIASVGEPGVVQIIGTVIYGN